VVVSGSDHFRAAGLVESPHGYLSARSGSVWVSSALQEASVSELGKRFLAPTVTSKALAQPCGAPWKALVLSGRESRPGAGSLHPVAIRAATEETKSSEPLQTDQNGITPTRTREGPIPASGLCPRFARASGRSQTLQPYTDVTDAFVGNAPLAYWYYGHAHVGAAYAVLKGNGILCRCLGPSLRPQHESKAAR